MFLATYIDLSELKEVTRMEVPRLLAKKIINRQTEANYRLHSTLKEETKIHRHDFYEFFLITKGSAIHVVHGQRLLLHDGALVFIRPDDIHGYERYGDIDCQYINLAFPQKTVHALAAYLGDGFSLQQLLRPSLPPRVELSRNEKEYLQSQLQQLNTLPYDHRAKVRAALRALLVELFTKYFVPERWERKSSLPDWLDALCRKMQKKECFLEGIPAMLRISGKSQEHLNRMLKKYLNMTPTGFINDLRLNYAANLLITSDESILSVSLEAGFENLSHFYHMFKKRFALSPSKFRRQNTL